MIIRLKKVDQGVVLSCTREDGTVEVQRTGHGGFFALHDLLHYTIETTLGLDRAFLGLVNQGWSISTFGDRDDPRSKEIPSEAIAVEHLVNLLSQRLGERAVDDPELWPLWSDEIRAAFDSALEKDDLPAMRIERNKLRRIADRFRELADAWTHLPRGEHLELPFPAE